MSPTSPAKKHQLAQVLAIVTGLLPGFQAHAELEEDALFLMLSGDEELISIATGTPRPTSKAPAVASVITAEQIRASGATTVQQALEQVPGLHIGMSTFNRGKPLFSFRGIQTANSPQTLVLINGHGIPDTFSGSIAPGLHLPIENVARIEVIRGPGSAMYGADAFAGVINIITKTDADIDGAQAGVRAGSFNTQSVWGQYGGANKGWHMAASVEYNKSDGDTRRIIDSDLQSILDASPPGTSASLAPGPLETRYESLVTGLTLAKDEWQFQFNSWNQRDTGVGAGIANALDPAGKTDIDQYLLSLQYNKKDWLPNWALNIDASYMQSETAVQYVIFPPNTLLPIGSDGNIDFITPAGFVSFTDGYIGNPTAISDESKFDVTTLYNGMLAHQWRFNAGVKYTKETDKSTQNFGPGVIDGTEGVVDGTLTDVTGTPSIFHLGATRTVVYLSLQDEWQFAPDWIFTAGLRFDDYSDVGSTTNPRLSLVWNTTHDLTSKLLYGRAFRAPTFGELNAINNPATIGNPDLDPEIINTLELAFDYKPLPTLNVLFNLFHYEIDGLIDFVPDGNGGSKTAQNTIDQKASGFELEARWQVSKSVRLFGNTAFQNAENKDTDDKVVDAPRKQLQLGANWQFSQKWSSQLDGFAIMDRPRASGDTREQVDDYNWVNLSINGRDIFRNVSIQFAIRNLFDTDAREPGPGAIPNDYPLEGRSGYVGISSTF